jgi:hypothetical protein
MSASRHWGYTAEVLLVAEKHADRWLVVEELVGVTGL